MKGIRRVLERAKKTAARFAATLEAGAARLSAMRRRIGDSLDGMGKISREPEFVTEVAARFASGMMIESIAAWAGCTKWEIEAVLRENAAAIREAFDRTEALGGTRARSGDADGITGA